MSSQRNRRSWASIFMLSTIPHVPVDLGAHCSEAAEFVGVAITIVRELTTVISAYLRPGVSWDTEVLREICHACSHRLPICGDSNAHNTSWGSSFSSVRGRDLSDSITGLDLLVLSDGRPTFQRPGASSNVLDLTVASRATELLWSVEPDTWGSDHYPIRLTSMHSERRPSRRYNVMHWNTFRLLLERV